MVSLDGLPRSSTSKCTSLKSKDTNYMVLFPYEETNSKFSQILCKDIIWIFYKDNHLQFLLDLEQSPLNHNRFNCVWLK